jgi:hypothetical protein
MILKNYRLFKNGMRLADIIDIIVQSKSDQQWHMEHPVRHLPEKFWCDSQPTEREDI